jgi:hypothetical protein
MGNRREEEILVERGEEDGTGRRQQFQTGVFTAFSAWPFQSVNGISPRVGLFHLKSRINKHGKREAIEYNLNQRF